MDMLRIEQQRQALEESMQKLRQSLKYWQTFEAEYEGLKEEIVEAQPNINVTQLTNLSTSYDGEMVTEQVIRELAGLDKDSPRTGLQIIRDIERRQEYVQKNIETIQRRFFEAEAKLEEFDFAATRDGETGLPLTEITEELDDDDNVVSTHLSQPETQQARLVESLRKAGLSEDDLAGGEADKPLKPAITNASPPATPGLPGVIGVEKRLHAAVEQSAASGDAAQDDLPHPNRPPLRKKSVSFAANTKEAPEIVRLDSEDGRKSVSFADKVAVAPAAPLPDPRSVSFSPKVEEIPAGPLGPDSPQVAAQAGASQPETAAQKELRTSFKPGDKVKTVGDDDEVIEEQIVLPENESEEDARARREMLDYHLHEVGHIVAQINLDEGNEDGDDYDDDEDDDDDTSSHFTGSTYLDDEDTPYTSGLSDDEDEDEHGRSKRKMVSEEYRKDMLAMQERLIGNLGPTPKAADVAELDPEINPADARRLVIRGDRGSMSSIGSDSSDKKGKKRVSFAESINVAENEPASLKAQKTLDGENVAPVSAIVAERDTEMAPVQPPTPAKVSKFKQSRVPASAAGSADPSMNLDSTFDDAPTGPAGQILADSLIERPSATKSTLPPSADDMDPVAERRQLAAEYYRRRNELVRQQGGFKGNPEEDEELGELMEERPDGRVRKVSRFKAARIKP